MQCSMVLAEVPLQVWNKNEPTVLSFETRKLLAQYIRQNNVTDYLILSQKSKRSQLFLLKGINKVFLVTTFHKQTDVSRFVMIWGKYE